MARAENRRSVEDHLLMVAGFLMTMSQLMIVVGGLGLGLASTMSLDAGAGDLRPRTGRGWPVTRRRDRRIGRGVRVAGVPGHADYHGGRVVPQQLTG